MPRHEYPPEYDDEYCENCDDEACGGCTGEETGFDCIVDGGHFTDSIGIFDSEEEANAAGYDWIVAQCYVGESWVEDSSDPMGGYWEDDDAPTFEVVPCEKGAAK